MSCPTIYTYEKLKYKIIKNKTLNNIRESPLAMYIFTMEPEVQNLFIHGTQSGGILLNDTIMHYAGKKTNQIQFLIKTKETFG